MYTNKKQLKNQRLYRTVKKQRNSDKNTKIIPYGKTHKIRQNKNWYRFKEKVILIVPIGNCCY